MDFTLDKYCELLGVLLEKGYSVQTFEDFIKNPESKVVVLRHDVDRRAINAVWMGEIEKKMKVRGSYYFRIVPESNNDEVIREVVSQGHEVGYHYEDMGMCKGDFEKAYEAYQKNLKHFRKYYPVSTICMHGSPENKIDNRELWKKYDYKKDDHVLIYRIYHKP